MISRFAAGWAGAGLLLIRLVGGSGLLLEGAGVFAPAGLQTIILKALTAIIGLAVLVGFRARTAGVLAAALELWLALSGVPDPLVHTLLATHLAALALLGPGAWSVDARLSGWKRIEIPKRPE